MQSFTGRLQRPPESCGTGRIVRISKPETRPEFVGGKLSIDSLAQSLADLNSMESMLRQTDRIMNEIIEFLGKEVSVPTLWLIAGALLLVSAGSRSVWPAVLAALLLFGFHFLRFFPMA